MTSKYLRPSVYVAWVSRRASQIYDRVRARHVLRATGVGPDTPGVFLDCGSNLGQGFSFFSTIFSPNFFTYHLFEPNPACCEVLEKEVVQSGPNITLHNVAVGTEYGRARFYGTSDARGGRTAQAGSLLASHFETRYGNVDTDFIEVEVINFLDFLGELDSKGRPIVIKFDIEGGEYELLDKLVARGLPTNLRGVFVEWHHKNFLEPERSRFRQIESSFQRACSKAGIPVVVWH